MTSAALVKPVRALSRWLVVALLLAGAARCAEDRTLDLLPGASAAGVAGTAGEEGAAAGQSGSEGGVAAAAGNSAGGAGSSAGAAHGGTAGSSGHPEGGAGGEHTTGGAAGSGGHAGAHAPTVTINHPGDGETRSSAMPVPFVGFANDVDGKAITGNSLVWTSNLVGSPLGTGASFSTTLAAGTHLITLTATDDLGHLGAASVTLHLQ